MKVTIELDNLEKSVEAAIENNIESVIKEEINTLIRKVIEEKAKNIIKDTVCNNFERFVNEYITTTTIKVGGNYWDDKEEETYTVEQFIKSELKNRLESNKLKVKKKGHTSSYSDDYELVTFEEYINRTFNIDEKIKKEFNNTITRFMDDIRKEINTTMKNTFDNSTKNMLSNAVLNILSANDTYLQIENNIKTIADKRNE